MTIKELQDHMAVSGKFLLGTSEVVFQVDGRQAMPVEIMEQNGCLVIRLTA